MNPNSDPEEVPVSSTPTHIFIEIRGGPPPPSSKTAFSEEVRGTGLNPEFHDLTLIRYPFSDFLVFYRIFGLSVVCKGSTLDWRIFFYVFEAFEKHKTSDQSKLHDLVCIFLVISHSTL